MQSADQKHIAVFPCDVHDAVQRSFVAHLLEQRAISLQILEDTHSCANGIDYNEDQEETEVSVWIFVCGIIGNQLVLQHRYQTANQRQGDNHIIQKLLQGSFFLFFQLQKLLSGQFAFLSQLVNRFGLVDNVLN